MERQYEHAERGKSRFRQRPVARGARVLAGTTSRRSPLPEYNNQRINKESFV